MIDKITFTFHSHRNIEEFCEKVDTRTNRDGVVQYEGFWHNFKVTNCLDEYRFSGSLSKFYNNQCNYQEAGNSYSMNFNECSEAIDMLSKLIEIPANQLTVTAFEFGFETILPKPIKFYIPLISGLKPKDGRPEYRVQKVNKTTIYFNRENGLYKDCLAIYDKNKERKQKGEKILDKDNLTKVEMRMQQRLKQRLKEEDDITLEKFQDSQFYEKVKQRLVDMLYGLYSYKKQDGEIGSSICSYTKAGDCQKWTVGLTLSVLQWQIDFFLDKMINIDSITKYRVKTYLKDCLAKFEDDNDELSEIDKLSDFLIERIPD